jgi:hypothetical protein
LSTYQLSTLYQNRTLAVSLTNKFVDHYIKYTDNQ